MESLAESFFVRYFSFMKISDIISTKCTALRASETMEKIFSQTRYSLHASAAPIDTHSKQLAGSAHACNTGPRCVRCRVSSSFQFENINIE